MYTISVYINQFNSSNVFSYSGTNFLQKMSASSHPRFFIALYVMIPGSKGHKSDASLLAGGFLNLGPAKNMSKKPFFEEK